MKRRSFLKGILGAIGATTIGAIASNKKPEVEIENSKKENNEWTHIAKTYDGNEIKIYENGIITNISKYNRVLSEEEIKNINSYSYWIKS